MPGYWRRPIARVYSYNLDLGENYYSPMKVTRSGKRNHINKKNAETVIHLAL